MAHQAPTGTARGPNPWRIAAWSIAALLLLLPLAAMQFTSEVNWDGADFVFAAVMIGSVGLLAELTVRRTRNLAYRAAAGFAVAAGFLIVWANGAVGMIGDEDNGYNLLFIAIVLLALIGAFAARFGAAGMSLVMLAAGIVHSAVAILGIQQDPRGGVFSLAFAGFWLASAALFHLAARRSEG
jgi:hypothetical protein